MFSLFWKFLFFFIILLVYFSSSAFPWRLNLGPNKSKENTLSICHWNLNGITVHSFSKLSQLKAYVSIYKHDFICLSETYLASSTASNIIDIEGYNFFRSDHPDDIKRAGVYIYYKESLPIWVINLPFLKGTLLLEMCYNKKSDCVRNLLFPKPQ